MENYSIMCRDERMGKMDEVIRKVQKDIKEQFEINEEIEFENSKDLLEAFKEYQIS